MKHLILYIFLSYSLFALPLGVENAIIKSGISKNDISIYIKETGAYGGVVASLNAKNSVPPASVIKVMTTYASLLKLGFNHRFPTQFYTKGKLKNGQLYGDLIVKGFGDPTLCTANLKSIVSEIKARGIRGIRGNIIIDRSYLI